MLRLIALFVLVRVVAAQSPSPDPTVLVNGGGTMPQNQNLNQNPNNLRGTFDSKTGGDPRPVNGGLRLTTGTQLGGTAQLGSTAGTQTVLGGTASIGTTPNLVPSTTTQTIGTVSSAVGDPEIRGFDGNAFQFEGQAGSFYEALGGANHQVSVNLKLGVMHDHNGTYIQGVGVNMFGHRIVVKLGEKDKLQVLADSMPLAFPADSHALNETLGAQPEAAHIDWQLYRPKYGNSVEISSALLTTRVWKTEAGVLDKGGVPQPAYLNFEMALNSFPTEPLKGFMGESYNRAVDASRRKLQAMDSGFDFRNSAELYNLPGFFT
ncbi:g2394 [Coccomyxa viridis]|uniref:G2394 protein n=1 Tax=Coccomyxa viridis TaxID=1274662 RepID=A0ABP1FKB4_9CHLO